MDRGGEDVGTARLSLTSLTLDTLALRIMVLKALSDRVKTHYEAAKLEIAKVLGEEGRKNATLDGMKIGSVSVTKPRVRVYDEAALAEWVNQRYPSEVEVVMKVRPAFLESIKKSTERAGEPCGPGGELDVPGVEVAPGYPTPRLSPEGLLVINDYWVNNRINLDGSFKELE